MRLNDLQVVGTHNSYHVAPPTGLYTLFAERARAWVVVRMMHNAASALTDGADPRWLTTCVAVAKAVQP